MTVHLPSDTDLTAIYRQAVPQVNATYFLLILRLLKLCLKTNYFLNFFCNTIIWYFILHLFLAYISLITTCLFAYLAVNPPVFPRILP